MRGRDGREVGSLCIAHFTSTVTSGQYGEDRESKEGRREGWYN